MGWPRLLIQYIRSYLQCLEAVSSIRNPRTRHDTVTGTHVTCLYLQPIQMRSVSCIFVSPMRATCPSQLTFLDSVAEDTP
jgi:hypothetical protein